MLLYGTKQEYVFKCYMHDLNPIPVLSNNTDNLMIFYTGSTTLELLQVKLQAVMLFSNIRISISELAQQMNHHNLKRHTL